MTMNTTENPLGYAAPRMAVMNASRTVIHNQVAALKLAFLPAMKEKLLPLQRALTQADSVFRQQLGTIVVKLRTVQLDQLESTRQTVEAEASLNDEERRQALSQLDTEHARIVADLKKTIQVGAAAVAESIDDLAQINIELKDNRVKDSLQRQVDQLNQRSADLQVKLSAIAEDRRLLDETIKTLEKFNVLDIFKEQLPTAAELQALSMPSPELALAQAGIARLQKLLDGLGRTLTYFDLVSERDKLRARYNEALNESRQLEGESRQLIRDLDEVEGLASTHRSKTEWTTEARKASVALFAFHDSYMTDVQTRLTPEIIKQMVGYISSFYTVVRKI
jgi:hypothetical protein